MVDDGITIDFGLCFVAVVCGDVGQIFGLHVHVKGSFFLRIPKKFL